MTKLKEILITEGITQAELARSCNLAQGSINRYVNGSRVPSPVSKSKIVNGINEKLGNKKYEVVQIFDE